MYRRYKKTEHGLTVYAYLAKRDTLTEDEHERARTLLPVQTASAINKMPLQLTTEEILGRIRETVEHEGHGDSNVFIILGASVSTSC